MITTYIIIGVIVIAILCILIVLGARKASMSDTTTKTTVSSSTKTASSSASKTMATRVQLTAEQSATLKKASSELLTVRMSLNKIQDPEIRKAGAEACDSIEKVLTALREKPEKIQTNRQLFNYYLPTLDTVLYKYQRIEASGVDNDEIPANLKKYLSDIKDGMGNMYESLYDNDKLNVAVDMEAMTMAIKRDGLLDEDYFANINSINTADELDPGLKTKPDFDSVPNAAAEAYDAVKSTLVSEAEAVAEAAHEAVSEAGAVVDNAKAKIEGTAEEVKDQIAEVVEDAAEEVKDQIAESAGNVAQIPESVADSAEDLFEAAKEAVENDFAGLKEAVPVEADKTNDILFSSGREIKLTLEPAVKIDEAEDK